MPPERSALAYFFFAVFLAGFLATFLAGFLAFAGFLAGM